MRIRSIPALLLALVAASPTLASAQTIDTRTGTINNSGGGGGIFGQTFTVGAGQTSLNSFSFWVNGFPSGNYSFEAFLFQWTGTGITGPALYQSEVRSTAGTTLVEQLFAPTGGVTLTVGDQYVALLQRTELSVNGLSVGTVGADSYTGGEWVGGAAFDAAGVRVKADVSDPRTRFSSSSRVPGGDMMFVATFNAATVPEPGTLLLLVSGLAALAIVSRRSVGSARAVG